MMIKQAQARPEIFQTAVLSLVPQKQNGRVDQDWAIKRAVAGLFRDSDVTPAAGHGLLHVLAMGDSEFYGMNRNADVFYGYGRQLDLKNPDWTRVKLAKAGPNGEPRYHDKNANTFTTTVQCGNADRAFTFEKYAKVFREHENKPYPHKDPKTGKMLPPDKIYGNVKASAHNPEMHRIELLLEVPLDKYWTREFEKIARGEDLGTSMSCKIPYDVCLDCGHIAQTPDDYCPHMAIPNRTKMARDGFMQGVANEGMTYFDISHVARPADRIAWSLYGVVNPGTGSGLKQANSFELPGAEKVASIAAVYSDECTTPDDAAQARRIQLARKLASMEKIIPLTPLGATLKPLLAGQRLKKTAAISQVPVYDLPDTFRELADCGICLDLPAWAELVYGTALSSERVKQATEQLRAGIYSQPGVVEKVARVGTYDPSTKAASAGAACMASRLTSRYGLWPEVVRCQVFCAENPVGLGYGVKQAAVSDDSLVLEYAGYQLAYLDHVAVHRPVHLEFVTTACVVRNLL